MIFAMDSNVNNKLKRISKVTDHVAVLSKYVSNTNFKLLKIMITC